MKSAIANPSSEELVHHIFKPLDMVSSISANTRLFWKSLKAGRHLDGSTSVESFRNHSTISFILYVKHIHMYHSRDDFDFGFFDSMYWDYYLLNWSVCIIKGIFSMKSVMKPARITQTAVQASISLAFKANR